MGRVQSLVRSLWFCAILIWLCPTNPAAAQCQSAPAAYSAACADMQSYISPFNSTIASQWKDSKSSSAFGTELLGANSNISLTGILSAQAMTRVQTELDDLSKLGLQFVTIGVSFPILYEPFYTYNRDPQDYASVLSFYQNVMAAVHQKGMKVLIETTVVFPDYATDLPLNAYYATLSTTQFNAGRAQQALIVAQQLQPDWMNLGSEPDTISELTGLPAEYTAAEWATQVSTIVAQLRSAGIEGKPLIGAGCGAWQQGGSDYVTALMSTGIDYFDMHTFSVDMGMLNDAVQYIDMATAAGKSSAISEVWDHPLTDAQLQGLTEYGIINLLAAAEPYNDYSFWATQDAQFLAEIIELAYWKKLYYVSPFESELFVANVNYNEYSFLSGPQLTAQETLEEGVALNDGILSPLGLWYAAAIKSSNAVTLSAAWNSGAAPVAPASMISIYGTNLATMDTQATSLPLPKTLAGASVSITDATGVQTSLPLFFAGPNQINAEIPASVSVGPAVIAINTPSGTVDSAVTLSQVAPALFTANEGGQGAASAQIVTNELNGQQITADTYSCEDGSCVGVPLDVSSGATALVLYGTGIQNRASLSDVTVTIGSQTLPAFYAGSAGYAGLDQVNVMLPASLAGSGTVNISVTIAGTQSNVVTATIQ